MSEKKIQQLNGFIKLDTRYIVLLSPLILFIMPLLSGKSLFWGVPSLQFIPWEAYAWENLLHGIFPFWNNLNGMGAPLMANYQLAIFYPPNWLSFPFYALGGTSWLAWSKNILLFLHLVWAGAGMLKLMEKLGFDNFSQSVTALSFQLCAYLVTRLGFFSMIWSASWIPWILFTASKIAFPGDKEKKTQQILFLPLILSLFFQLIAGHAQLSWYTLVLSGFWVLVGGCTQSGLKGCFNALLRLFCNVLLAALLASVQLLPTAELLLLSQRSSAVGYETVMTYSFWPWRLLTLLAPNLFGSPANGDYWGYASYWEDAIYLGIIPFMMVLNTLKLLRNKVLCQRVLVTFLWVFSGISILLALGQNTPVFPFLYRYIPTFDMFSAPARYLIWLELAFSILAGIGVVHWKKPAGKGLYWLRLGTAGGFAISLGSFLTLIFVGDVKTTFIKAFALAGFWLVGAGILTLIQPERQSRKGSVWQAAVILWVFLDLVSFSFSFTPFVEKDFYDSGVIGHEQLIKNLDGHRLFIGSEDEYQLKYKRFLRFKDFQSEEPWINLRYALIPNSNMLEGISSVNNFDPLLPAYYADFLDQANSSDENKLQNFLSLMDVQVIEKRNKSEENGISWEIASKEPANVRWFPCAIMADSRELAEGKFNSIISDEKKFNNWLVLEDYSGSAEEICYEKSDFVNVITERTPLKMTLELNVSENGWLMISETWYPGWKADIDGKNVPVYRADLLFRAVYVESGIHSIEFFYFPMMFFTGLGISLAAFVFLFWLFKIKRINLK